MAGEVVEIGIGTRTARHRTASDPSRSLNRAAIVGVQPGRQVDQVAAFSLTVDKLQRRNLGRELKTLQALRTIRDLNPTASQAIWNYMRLVNMGLDFKAYQFDGKGNEQEERGKGQQYLDDLVRRIGAEYGTGLDAITPVLTLSFLTNGAGCLEVAPTEDLNDVEDWYVIDPALVEFQRYDDGTLVLGWRPRATPGRFTPLPPEQVFYAPLDPDVDDPYGRPPMASVISSVMAKAQLINDLRAVIHNQGYPRIDLEMNTEHVMGAAPMHLKEAGKQQELTAWVDEQVASVIRQFKALEVDDSFAHLDFLKVNIHDAGTTMDFEKVENILTREMNSGLKTLPIMLGFNESATESHGSVQWQIQVAGINAVRRVVKRLVERGGNVSLRLAGIQAHSKINFEEIRTVDRLYEAQAALFEAKTAAFEEQMGWRDHNESANLITGHDAKGPMIIVSDSTSTIPGEGPQPPKGADQGSDQQKTSADHAWELLWRSPDGVTRAPTEEDIAIEAFGRHAGRIFLEHAEAVIAALQAEGELRDVPLSVAEDVFGRSFARQMKALIREAMDAGIDAADVDFEVSLDERTVDRIWQGNRTYVDRIKGDLKAAIRAGEFSTVEDVRAWFRANEHREILMGKFLAKQGYNAGYALARTAANTRTRFVWELGVVVSKHCGTCSARAGTEYTYDELRSVGFPGSDSLECGGQCKCSIVEVQ